MEGEKRMTELKIHKSVFILIGIIMLGITVAAQTPVLDSVFSKEQSDEIQKAVDLKVAELNASLQKQLLGEMADYKPCSEVLRTVNNKSLFVMNITQAGNMTTYMLRDVLIKGDGYQNCRESWTKQEALSNESASEMLKDITNVKRRWRLN